jgi:hypothetical protein
MMVADNDFTFGVDIKAAIAGIIDTKTKSCMKIAAAAGAGKDETTDLIIQAS